MVVSPATHRKALQTQIKPVGPQQLLWKTKKTKKKRGSIHGPQLTTNKEDSVFQAKLCAWLVIVGMLTLLQRSWINMKENMKQFFSVYRLVFLLSWCKHDTERKVRCWTYFYFIFLNNWKTNVGWLVGLKINLEPKLVWECLREIFVAAHSQCERVFWEEREKSAHLHARLGSHKSSAAWKVQ